MDWSTYLRRLRRGRGASQAEFAALLGVSQTTVWRWETGQAVPDRGILDKLLRSMRLPDGTADRAAMEAASMTRGVASLSNYQSDRYLAISQGVIQIQRAPYSVLMSVSRSRSTSEESRRVLADRALMNALFSGEILAVRVSAVNARPFTGGSIELETVWTPVVLSDGTRCIRCDSRRAPAPFTAGVDVVTVEKLMDFPSPDGIAPSSQDAC